MDTSKPTERAMRAASVLICDDTEYCARIINTETGLPALLAEVARLRGALEQFRNELQVVDSSGEGRPLAWFTLRLKRLAAALAENKD